MHSLEIISELSQLNRVRTFVKKILHDLHPTDEDYYIIELSLLEICINIIRYAYPGQKGRIRIQSWEKDQQIFFEIQDDGRPFDPRKAKKPEISDLIKPGKKGGLGVFLTRELMDGFEYHREEGKNILILSKRINPSLSDKEA
jgi:serine/threonine-protein kinase RsbW